MKKTVKIILPIVLVLVTLLCTIWYLFVYDREFTRDMLLSCARYSESRGNHDIAAWFYNRAYTQSGDNDAVAIELAQQYKDSGNYTKAEFTLRNAIKDGGGADLYVELCSTYVEQNKLMDAVAMLNSIVNPEVKTIIDSMRPAAPTASLESGTYKHLITLELSCERGTLYATADGSYPSIKTSGYTEPLSLPEGESNVYALCIDENGLVSPLAIYGYTVGGIIEEAIFTDPSFESAIRLALGADKKSTLYTDDVWTLEQFTIPSDAASYADLKYLPNLKELTVVNGISEELGAISGLSSLEKLNITGTGITQSDLTTIGALPMLKELTLSDCGITSIAPLSDATGITKLDLSNNTIRNIDAVKQMSGLTELNLDHNVVTDLSAIADLKALTKLSVSYNTLTTLEAVTGNTALTWLSAGHNSIETLGQLQKLTGLNHLDLSYNALQDIAPVAACSAINELDISNNALTDISSLSALTKLSYLNFSHNEVAQLPQWSADCALVSINGSNNQITSIEPLVGLKKLNNVFMDYNDALTSIGALVDCPMLIQVDVYGTAVTDAKALTHTNDGMERGIIVNYDPTKK